MTFREMLEEMELSLDDEAKFGFIDGDEVLNLVPMGHTEDSKVVIFSMNGFHTEKEVEELKDEIESWVSHVEHLNSYRD